MKKGDKVYCIKDNYDGTFDYHYKGNWYVIEYITDEITESITDNNIVYVHTDLNVPFRRFGYNSIAFRNHFVTESQYRKLKLEKLSDV